MKQMKNEESFYMRNIKTSNANRSPSKAIIDLQTQKQFAWKQYGKFNIKPDATGSIVIRSRINKR